MKWYPGAADFATSKKPQRGPDFKRRVEWLILVRLIVTTLLLVATIFFHLQERGASGIQSAVPLYVLIGATFVLSLLYAIAVPVISNLWAFSYFQVLVDVIYYTVLVYFTGGASSAFTLIYVFPITASGMLHFRRGAILTASVSAILFGSLVALQYHHWIPESGWPWAVSWMSRTPGYVLWVLVVHFTVFGLAAFMATSLAEQLQKTRSSLAAREHDYRVLAQLHSSIVRSIPSGIITTDQLDRVTFVNSAGLKLLAVNLRDMVGRDVRSIFPVIDDAVSKSGTRTQIFSTSKLVEDVHVDLELTVSDLKAEDGTPSGRLVVFEDVSRIKRMEERVRTSERQAAFVRIAAGMAHEVRNPLAAMRGASELLRTASSPTPHQTKLLDILLRESDRINALIEDFIATVGTRPMVKRRLLLDDLVEEMVHTISEMPEINEKVTFETLIHQSVEVEGEPKGLKQAIGHLLSNACDASRPGSVIRIVLVIDHEENEAVLEIHDSGTGISTEIRDRMFEPFATTKDDGSGLGLPIVLTVAEAHGGAVEFHNSAQGGSIFALRLPLATAHSSVGQGVGANG